MNTLSIRRFGFALGTACALTYLACACVMSYVPREATIRFFNRILHGLDVTSILTSKMTLGGVITGAIEVFVLGWLFGAILACFYNISGRLDDRRAPAARD